MGYRSNLAEHLLATAAGRAPVLVEPAAGVHTYDDLRAAVAHLSTRYRADGLTGQRVGLELSPTFPAVAAYLALLATDNTVVLARHADQPPWADYLAAAEVVTVLAAPTIGLDLEAGEDLDPDLAPPLEFTTPTRPAVNLFTSGTTGRPKMVELSHDALRSSCDAILDRVRLRPDSRTALVLSLAHSFGLSVLNTHLRVGASLYCVERVEFPGDVLRAFTEGGANAMAGVPTQLRTLTATIARSPERRLEVDTVLQAGGRLEPDDAKALVAVLPPDCGLYQMYGQTEAAARIAILPADAYAKVPTSVGTAIDGLTVRIVGDDGADAPAGVDGEIVVRGTTIMDGYYGDPAATAAVLRDGWLHTGDLGHVDEDGYLYISGRHSTFVKVDGERISLEAVEHAAISSHPDAISDALAGAVKSDRGWALTLDVVVTGGDHDWRALQRSLKEAVRLKLGKKAAPAVVREVESVPYTHNGKKARPNIVY
jgi:acyl-CoA synthetase (AMP-forming)/AMP-acid ligase II